MYPTGTFAPGSILLDNTAILEDVFWGLYYWLDANPTETILVSIKIDNGDNTVALQQQLYSLFTDADVADYWVHNNTVCPHKHTYQQVTE
jgi:1-phosphatidylinositol phosphodiesterase